MGHIHLAQLPRTRAWRDVVALLDAGAVDDVVIAAAAIAAEKELTAATDDPVFVEAVRLLAMVPHAAASDDFGGELTRLGLFLPDEPIFVDLLAATGRRLDEVAVSRGRSDFGELARRALSSAFATEIGRTLRSLFGSDEDDLRRTTRRLAQPPEFARLARRFFGELTAISLASWLDRVLATRIGPGQRFADVGDRDAFDVALELYCAEATRIIREFAAGWYGKRVWRNGGIDSRDAAAFGHIAFRKIGEELRRKRDG